MNIIVKTIDDGSYPLTISSNSSLLELKEKIKRLTEIPNHLQRLIYKGRVMNDELKSLSDYGIMPNTSIHLVKRNVSVPSRPIAMPSASRFRSFIPRVNNNNSFTADGPSSSTNNRTGFGSQLGNLQNHSGPMQLLLRAENLLGISETRISDGRISPLTIFYIFMNRLKKIHEVIRTRYLDPISVYFCERPLTFSDASLIAVQNNRIRELSILLPIVQNLDEFQSTILSGVMFSFSGTTMNADSIQLLANPSTQLNKSKMKESDEEISHVSTKYSLYPIGSLLSSILNLKRYVRFNS